VPQHSSAAAKLSTAVLVGVLPVAAIFLLVFGGIYSGWFTPGEGAAVGTLATLVVALFKRELTWAKLRRCALETAVATGMIFLVFLGADIMNAALALTQVPVQLAEWAKAWQVSPVVVVAAILLLYVVLGSVMDELSMLLLTIPIFFPMIMALDFGMSKEYTAIWFGIMVLMTVGFGLLAPPVGLNVYVVNGMANNNGHAIPIAESYKGVMPFLLADTVRTVLLLLFPMISLGVLRFMG
jgi:C4-dicarboxylate transporter, DctM subunit